MKYKTVSTWSFPENTATPAAYLPTGPQPISAQLSIKVPLTPACQQGCRHPAFPGPTGGDILLAEQFLNNLDIMAILKSMRGKRVMKGVAGGVLGKPCLAGELSV